MDHVSVVDLYGRITIGEGDIVLRETVHDLLENGHQHILLNLKNVSYLDSAGIGELVACYNLVTEKNGALKLLNASRWIYNLLRLTKLDEVFETFRDEKESLASFLTELAGGPTCARDSFRPD